MLFRTFYFFLMEATVLLDNWTVLFAFYETIDFIGLGIILCEM